MKNSKRLFESLSIMTILVCSTFCGTAQSAWLLTGNSVTDPSVNFIGTTDLQPLKFRINNIPAGELNPVNGNIALGINTLLSNTIGTGNVAIGTNTLCHNIRGRNLVAVGDSALFNYSGLVIFSNTAIGSKALFSTTSGYRNTATGFQALYSNTTGFDNTAIGSQALYSNKSTGRYNTAVGSKALYANTTGIYNTANGAYALTANTAGSGNTATGFQALYANKVGTGNSAYGYNALFFDTASYNTASGYQALYSNTIGFSNTANGYNALASNSSGNYNTATGETALNFNTIGFENAAHGEGSLYNNIDGSLNTANGYQALYKNNNGVENTATGATCLYANTIGDYNTGDGYGAGPLSSNLSNTTSLGYYATATASYQVRIGNNTVTSIGGYANWSNISDGRVKKNIKANIPGLAFINKLKPITYNLDLDAADKIIQRPVVKTKDGKTIEPTSEQIASRKIKEQIVYTGFIAQDVEKAAKELNYDFSGVDAAKNDKDLYGLRYAEFVVPLVKAVQELSMQNDELKQRVAKLESLMNTQQLTTNDKQTITLGNASLEQNSPNPFNQSTTIRYTLPASRNFGTAQIVITDQSGKILKQINISTLGKGMLNIQAGSLAAGTYNYSLYIDDHLVDTKKMAIVK